MHVVVLPGGDAVDNLVAEPLESLFRPGVEDARLAYPVDDGALKLVAFHARHGLGQPVGWCRLGPATVVLVSGLVDRAPGVVLLANSRVVRVAELAADENRVTLLGHVDQNGGLMVMVSLVVLVVKTVVGRSSVVDGEVELPLGLMELATEFSVVMEDELELELRDTTDVNSST